MHMKFANRLSFFSTLALGILAVSPAPAQTSGKEKPLRYIYNATWVVPRNMWADYQKMQASDDDLLRKFVADGTLHDFGSYSVLNHQDGQATHGTWFSASSMERLMKVLEAERSAPENSAPSLAASKHWDYVLKTRDYNGHSGSFNNGYLRVGVWTSKPGAADSQGAVIRSTLVPALEKLLEEGALHAYSIDEEAVHSSDPGVLWVAIAANGAAGLDKYDAAVEAMQKKDPAAAAGFVSLIESHGHRDILAHVDSMTWK
jgi:hypothetical protein